ncbi:hypothetical protein VTL71DRAFT_5633 [Oculimacula yallundae]|uniref:Integral membrane protein n=1 Tax=Oculimacula yallundae TaxID=86028 RepID=A0ABR4C1P0_9HELO
MSSHLSSGFAQRLHRMFTRFPVNDTRYLTAIFFLLGAIFFTINGLLYVFAYTEPKLFYRPLSLPATSCIGDFLFILGCTSAIFEAMNTEKRALANGVVVELDLEIAQETALKAEPEAGSTELVKSLAFLEERVSTPAVAHSQNVLIGDPSFTWIPSRRNFRDIAFIASVIWFIGIIFFTIATIAYIPGVANLGNLDTYYYLALLPTFLGGLFFLVAAFINMLLSQKKWYVPAVTKLDWHVGFWNSIGSLGFALGGCLWYVGESAYFAAVLASFWGAWGWVIGSVLRWYVVMGSY